MSTEFQDEVFERLMPVTRQLVHRAGMPQSALLDVQLSHFINEDRTHWIAVHVFTDDGLRLLARLHPARYGLCLIGDELATLEDPGQAFAPLPEG